MQPFGIQIEKDEEGSYFLSQKPKILDLIESLGFEDAYSVVTPMESDFFKQGKAEPLPSNDKYREAVYYFIYQPQLDQTLLMQWEF